MTAFVRIESNSEYHSDMDYISASGLKLLAKSPKHYWTKYLDPNRTIEEPTPAMLFGTLVHTLVLEPHTFDNWYVAMPDGIDKRTKEGKALWAEFQANNAGKTIIAQETLDEAKKVAQSVKNHPASAMINSDFGCAELSIRWEETIGSRIVQCKARPDFLINPNRSSAIPGGLVIDVKTAKDAAEGFAKDAYNLGYHIQAAFYLRAFKKTYNVEAPPFVFLVAEKEAPFAVMAYRATEEFIAAGEAEVERLLKLYAECKESNVWPCYPESIQELNLPRWAKENYV